MTPIYHDIPGYPKGYTVHRHNRCLNCVHDKMCISSLKGKGWGCVDFEPPFRKIMNCTRCGKFFEIHSYTKGDRPGICPGCAINMREKRVRK